MERDTQKEKNNAAKRMELAVWRRWNDEEQPKEKQKTTKWLHSQQQHK